jgi:transcription-repair coupling factor (superfamily II helicase)
VALTNLAHRINALAPLDEVVSWCRSAEPNRPETLHLKGAVGSLPAFILHRVNQVTGRPMLCLLADADAAAYLTSDLEQLGSDLLLLPPTGHHPYDDEQMEDPLPLIQRADVLQQLSDGFTGLLVASADALYERVPPPETFDEETLVLSLGQGLSPLALVEDLVDHRFERVECV